VLIARSTLDVEGPDEMGYGVGSQALVSKFLADPTLRAGKAVLDAIQDRASVGPRSSFAL